MQSRKEEIKRNKNNQIFWGLLDELWELFDELWEFLELIGRGDVEGDDVADELSPNRMPEKLIWSFVVLAELF